MSDLQFPVDAMFIRGYNTTVDFQLTLTNLETTLRVDAPLTGSVNYDISVTTAHPGVRRRRRDVTPNSATTMTQMVEISDSVLSQELDYDSQITISGQVRKRCSHITSHALHGLLSYV